MWPFWMTVVVYFKPMTFSTHYLVKVLIEAPMSLIVGAQIKDTVNSLNLQGHRENHLK